VTIWPSHVPSTILARSEPFHTDLFFVLIYRVSHSLAFLSPTTNYSVHLKICHSLSHGRHFKSFSINVKCPDPCEDRLSTRREKQQVERLLLRSTSSAAQAQSNYHPMVHSTARMHFLKVSKASCDSLSNSTRSRWKRAAPSSVAVVYIREGMVTHAIKTTTCTWSHPANLYHK